MLNNGMTQPVVSFMTWPFHPQGKSLQYTQNMRLSGDQSCKSLAPAMKQTQLPSPQPSLCSNCVIATPYLTCYHINNKISDTHTLFRRTLPTVWMCVIYIWHVGSWLKSCRVYAVMLRGLESVPKMSGVLSTLHKMDSVQINMGIINHILL